MTAVVGNNFFFDWEIALMEWLQASLPADGPLFWLISNLSAFGEELLMVAVMGFLYWGLNKEFGKYLGLRLRLRPEIHTPGAPS